MKRVQITIIGGGMIGSAIAYFLARTGQAGLITVIEPDPNYTLAATPKGTGGIRQLFSQPENIAMSKVSLQFYQEFSDVMQTAESSADIDFNQRGYLFVVRESGAKQLESNYNQQTRLGVNVLLLDQADLKERFPSLGVDDIALGCLSPEDGRCLTYASFTATSRGIFARNE